MFVFGGFLYWKINYLQVVKGHQTLFKQAAENMAIIGKNFEVGVIESGQLEFCKHIPEGVSGRNHSFW